MNNANFKTKDFFKSFVYWTFVFGGLGPILGLYKCFTSKQGCCAKLT